MMLKEMIFEQYVLFLS